jgi:hypothetical protein
LQHGCLFALAVSMMRTILNGSLVIGLHVKLKEGTKHMLQLISVLGSAAVITLCVYVIGMKLIDRFSYWYSVERKDNAR